MKINEIINEGYNPSKQYPDTEQGAIECFTDISIYSPSDVTKVYPDPYVSGVWAIHTNNQAHGSQKHVVYLNDHDFETDDRTGDEPFNINENATAGATSAGSIASIATPLGSEVIRRSVYDIKKKRKKNK